MGASIYKIGSTHGSIALLSSLTTPVRDPEREPLTYSAPTPVGDGSVKSLGWLRTFWHWRGVTVEERDQLYQFIGACNILTRDNSDDMTEYAAVMVWPDEEPEHYGGSVLDLRIEFRKLIAYSP